MHHFNDVVNTLTFHNSPFPAISVWVEKECAWVFSALIMVQYHVVCNNVGNAGLVFVHSSSMPAHRKEKNNQKQTE